MLVVMLHDMLVEVLQLMPHKDYTMKLLISTILVLGPLMTATPSFAVDNTISPLCRSENAGNTYQRPGGFCDAVASRGSQGLSGGTRCPAGTGWDNAVVGCVPEV